MSRPLSLDSAAMGAAAAVVDKGTVTAMAARVPALKVLAATKVTAAVRVKAAMAMARAGMVKVRDKGRVRDKARAKVRVRVRAKVRVRVAGKVVAAAWAAVPLVAEADRTRCRRAFRMAATTISSPVSCAKPQ
jgi:hypothetical protein